MQKMDETTERRILQALERAVDSVNLGSNPNDAICKEASAENFGPPIVQRMVEAFNTSKTISWIKQANVQKRAEAFELADAGKILERMYPSAPVAPAEATKQASAFADHDELRNYNIKCAFAKLPKAEYKAYQTENRDFSRWAAKSARLTRELGEYKVEFLRAKEAMLDNVKTAAAYFRTLGHEKFAEVETRVLSEYGKEGKACMDLVHEMSGLNEKRASEAPKQKYLFDRSRRPYAQVAGAIVQAKNAAHWSVKAAKVERDIEDHANGFYAFVPAQTTILGEVLADGKPFPVSGQQSNCLSDILTKDALDLTSAGLGLMGAVGLGSEPDSKQYEAAAMEQLNDPVHEAELSSARVRTMLNDFLSNDEVLSTYPEENVLGAYNQLANLAPTASQQPAIMRSLLRRMVQQGGVIEPFESGQLATIENTLRQRNKIPEVR